MVEKVPDSTYEMVGGLDKQIKEIKEVIELPVKHPELFDALGISQPKVNPLAVRSFVRSMMSSRVCCSTVHQARVKPCWLEPWLIIPSAPLFVCRALNLYRNSSVRVHEWFENCSSWLGKKTNFLLCPQRITLSARSEHAPSIIFMDEIDSIGSTRVEGSSGGDSEVQRTMLELLNQLDGFEPKQNIK